MFEYLKRNKEWIFSGIGVFFIVSLLSLGKSLFFSSDYGEVDPHSSVSKNVDLPKKSFSPVTLDELIYTLSDQNITKLQRIDFLKIHEGRYVKWDGIVENVEQAFGSDHESNILVVYRPVSQKEKTLPDLFTASFPYTAKNDLSALSSGDYIEFEGKLTILSPDTFPTPSIQNCVLLKHDKSKKP